MISFINERHRRWIVGGRWWMMEGGGIKRKLYLMAINYVLRCASFTPPLKRLYFFSDDFFSFLDFVLIFLFFSSSSFFSFAPLTSHLHSAIRKSKANQIKSKAVSKRTLSSWSRVECSNATHYHYWAIGKNAKICRNRSQSCLVIVNRQSSTSTTSSSSSTAPSSSIQTRYRQISNKTGSL